MGNFFSEKAFAQQQASAFELLTVKQDSTKKSIQVGDYLPYWAYIRNKSHSDLVDLTVTITPDRGLTLQQGSTYLINGNKSSPVAVTTSSTGYRLKLDLIEADQQLLLQYVLYFNSGGQGQWLNNILSVTYSASTQSIKVQSSVDIRVDQAPLLSQGTVIGKVYNDLNQNYIQDANEVGIEGARLVTLSGDWITTDLYGRYFYSAINANKNKQNFVLKLDARSLPAATKIIDENPKILRSSTGLLSKINFAVFNEELVLGAPHIITRRKKLASSSPTNTVNLLPQTSTLRSNLLDTLSGFQGDNQLKTLAITSLNSSLRGDVANDNIVEQANTVIFEDSGRSQNLLTETLEQLTEGTKQDRLKRTQVRIQQSSLEVFTVYIDPTQPIASSPEINTIIKQLILLSLKHEMSLQLQGFIYQGAIKDFKMQNIFTQDRELANRFVQNVRQFILQNSNILASNITVLPPQTNKLLYNYSIKEEPLDSSIYDFAWFAIVDQFDDNAVAFDSLGINTDNLKVLSINNLLYHVKGPFQSQVDGEFALTSLADTAYVTDKRITDARLFTTQALIDKDRNLRVEIKVTIEEIIDNITEAIALDNSINERIDVQGGYIISRDSLKVGTFFFTDGGVLRNKKDINLLVRAIKHMQNYVSSIIISLDSHFFVDAAKSESSPEQASRKSRSLAGDIADSMSRIIEMQKMSNVRNVEIRNLGNRIPIYKYNYKKFEFENKGSDDIFSIVLHHSGNLEDALQKRSDYEVSDDLYLVESKGTYYITAALFYNQALAENDIVKLRKVAGAYVKNFNLYYDTFYRLEQVLDVVRSRRIDVNFFPVIGGGFSLNRSQIAKIQKELYQIWSSDAQVTQGLFLFSKKE